MFQLLQILYSRMNYDDHIAPADTCYSYLLPAAVVLLLYYATLSAIYALLLHSNNKR